MDQNPSPKLPKLPQLTYLSTGKPKAWPGGWTSQCRGLALHTPQDTSSVRPYPQSDGSFTQISRLDLVPEEGQVYSCGVEHPSLKGERRTRMWTVEFRGPSLGLSIYCAVGLIVGLVGVAVGTFFLVKGNECR
ncbi:hypothetical protein WMY93_014034 [Mugilogobius chulae]|uniref:Immunoglobulin C1-set domain-containing protein n=1 Tax=Mugilogobius chulae TaxID=88201 RepID=A0AAW0P5G6_9GOBI